MPRPPRNYTLTEGEIPKFDLLTDTATPEVPSAPPEPDFSDNVTPPSEEALRRELLMLQIRKEREALREKEQLEADKEAKEREKEVTKQNLLRDITAARKAQEETQAGCAHIKPNGKPAIGGQKNHQHQIQWLCLICHKEWVGGELPIHLLNNDAVVGGPIT